jgi:hypothetical protein
MILASKPPGIRFIAEVVIPRHVRMDIALEIGGERHQRQHRIVGYGPGE